MEHKELQNIYLNSLKAEGYAGEAAEDGDISFKFEEEQYWITPDEDDLEFFDLYFLGSWDFKDEADKIKGLRTLNTVNQTIKLVKVQMNDDGIICFSAGFFVNEPKEFVNYLSRSLSMIQSAVSSFVEEMEK